MRTIYKKIREQIWTQCCGASDTLPNAYLSRRLQNSYLKFIQNVLITFRLGRSVLFRILLWVFQFIDEFANCTNLRLLEFALELDNLRIFQKN